MNISMKKLALISSTASYFFSATVTLAATQLNIQAPTQGYKDLGQFIGNIIQLAFGIAIVLVLVYLVWGAFDWITSGGDKDAVGKARSKIVNALIGIAVLAVAFALANTAAQFLGWTGGISGITIPTPLDNTPTPTTN